MDYYVYPGFRRFNLSTPFDFTNSSSQHIIVECECVVFVAVCSKRKKDACIAGWDSTAVSFLQKPMNYLRIAWLYIYGFEKVFVEKVSHLLESSTFNRYVFRDLLCEKPGRTEEEGPLSLHTKDSPPHTAPALLCSRWLWVTFSRRNSNDN